jgi:hypothetical protein
VSFKSTMSTVSPSHIGLAFARERASAADRRVNRLCGGSSLWVSVPQGYRPRRERLIG